MHPEIVAYNENRAKVAAEFQRKADEERKAFDADSSKFSLSDAISIVGIDKAIAAYRSGKLSEKGN